MNGASSNLTKNLNKNPVKCGAAKQKQTKKKSIGE
jgi:hypothetical protein